MISLLYLFRRQCRRELLLQFRDARQAINSALFFLMLLAFFPLTLPANSIVLRDVTPGIIWTAVLFAFFLSAERLFKQDYEDGVIEQWLVSGLPVSILVFVKIFVHWLINILPILVISPIIALLFKLTFYETLVVCISIICGSPTLLALCALSAAFGVSLKKRGVIMALILLPLAIPVLILGSASIEHGLHSLPIIAFLALLCAISIASLTLLSFAIAGIIKISLAE